MPVKRPWGGISEGDDGELIKDGKVPSCGGWV